MDLISGIPFIIYVVPGWLKPSSLRFLSVQGSTLDRGEPGSVGIAFEPSPGALCLHSDHLCRDRVVDR